MAYITVSSNSSAIRLALLLKLKVEGINSLQADIMNQY